MTNMGSGAGALSAGNLQWKDMGNTLPVGGAQPASGGDNNSAGGNAWGIASQALGGIGTLVDMFLKIDQARKSEKSRKGMEGNRPIGQSAMQIPMLGK